MGPGRKPEDRFSHNETQLYGISCLERTVRLKLEQGGVNDRFSHKHTTFESGLFGQLENGLFSFSECIQLITGNLMQTFSDEVMWRNFK